MTDTLLVAGTASHVGKSTLVAGLCRHLSNRGVDVVPYKAQNMSNNARVVPRAGFEADRTDLEETDDSVWGEIGVSQYVQARAARVTPTTDCNPVLLKPRGDGESQIVIHGRARTHVPAGAYYETYWEEAREAARHAHERLAARHDLVIAEGAGSIAEINLHERDLANVETARFADAEVLLVADIERGGAFGAIVGTLELLPADLRERVAGCVITRFRGDRQILEPGLDALEDRTGVPVLGVVPHDDPGLPEEDSVALPPPSQLAVRGDDDGIPDERAVTVAVPRLPRLSNATDLEPLAREPGVRVVSVPVDGTDGGGDHGDGRTADASRTLADADASRTLADADASRTLADADAVVLPGTKNTVDDLLALRDAGLDEAITTFDGPIVGLCGGYQLLGQEITNAALEGTGTTDRLDGLGLLPVRTRFAPEKTVEAVERQLTGVGPLAGASGAVVGYEIHAGDTELLEDVQRPFPDSGAASGRVLGTYLHGLFENERAREAFVENVYTVAHRKRPEPAELSPDAGPDPERRDPYERAGALVAEHVDLEPLSTVP